MELGLLRVYEESDSSENEMKSVKMLNSLKNL